MQLSGFNVSHLIPSIWATEKVTTYSFFPIITTALRRIHGLAPSREDLTKEPAQNTAGVKVVFRENFLLLEGVFAKFLNAWKDFDFGRRINCLSKVDQIDMERHHKLLIHLVSGLREYMDV